MNRLLVTTAFLILLSCQATSNDLQTAVKQNIVTANFFGNGGHRGNCIKLVIENKKNTTQKIHILPGTYLENEDVKSQDIIVVDDQTFVLNGREKREIILNGLCCKRTRRCPSVDKPFKMLANIDPAIAQLSQLILETKEFEFAGQEAMWSLVDKTDPNSIAGSDSTNTMKLRQLVGSKNNLPIKPFIWTDYNRPATITYNKLSIQTSGNHYVRNVQANDRVEYAVYDESDSAISEVKTNIVQANKWNKHNVVWNFALEELNPSKKFYLKIKVNGVIQKEWMYYFWG